MVAITVRTIRGLTLHTIHLCLDIVSAEKRRANDVYNYNCNTKADKYIKFYSAYND